MTRRALEDAVSADLVPAEVVLNSLKQEILTIIKKNKQKTKQANKLLKYLLVFLGEGMQGWCGVVQYTLVFNVAGLKSLKTKKGKKKGKR